MIIAPDVTRFIFQVAAPISGRPRNPYRRDPDRRRGWQSNRSPAEARAWCWCCSPSEMRARAQVRTRERDRARAVPIILPRARTIELARRKETWVRVASRCNVRFWWGVVVVVFFTVTGWLTFWDPGAKFYLACEVLVFGKALQLVIFQWIWNF